MEHTRIPLQAYKYQASGKRDIDRPRRRRETTILEAGTGDSPNPRSDDDDDDDDNNGLIQLITTIVIHTLLNVAL
jgi:hypothetical protein